LYYLAHSGSLEHVSHGVYRLRRFLSQRFEDVIVACLWAGEDAVASHDTTLAVYELTDAMPAHTHITLPRPFRGRRQGVIVHYAALPETVRTVRHAVPVTTVSRTIRDIATDKGPEAATLVATEALERGLLTRRQLESALRSVDSAASRRILKHRQGMS
jgi:predicted transcriptional regulator of viral defense system